MGVKKYFIAIVVPPPLFDEIEALKQELFERYALKGALRSPAHITLHRPFEWKEEREEELTARLREFSFSAGFPILLQDFAFFEPRVVYADVTTDAPLRELHDSLKRFASNKLGLLNEVNDLRGFHPHVTIAFRDLKKPLFYELRQEFEKRKLQGAFEYRGFALLKLEKKWEVLETFAH
jgi:2'-5' RNA ligase